MGRRDCTYVGAWVVWGISVHFAVKLKCSKNCLVKHAALSGDSFNQPAGFHTRTKSEGQELSAGGVRQKVPHPDRGQIKLAEGNSSSSGLSLPLSGG